MIISITLTTISQQCDFVCFGFVVLEPFRNIKSLQCTVINSTTHIKYQSLAMFFYQKRRKRRQPQYSLRTRHSKSSQQRSMIRKRLVLGFLVSTAVVFWIFPSNINDETHTSSRAHKFIEKVKQQKDTKQRLVEDCISFPDSVGTGEKWERLEHPLSAYQSWKDPNGFSQEDWKYINVPCLYGTRQLRDSLGNGGATLLTKAQADSIGSHIHLNVNTWNREPKLCAASVLSNLQTRKPDFIKLETINVMIASFRDGTMCKNTIDGIFNRAKYHQRIRVTVVDQVLPFASPFYDEKKDFPCISPNVPCTSDPSQVLCRYKQQIDSLPFDALDSSGPVFARHLGYRMYRGEYFVLTCDSHVEFTANWDIDIIEQWDSTNNEMAVLSVYPDDTRRIDLQTGIRLGKSRAIMCDTIFEDGDEGVHLRHDQQPSTELDFEDQQLQLQPLWGAGFSFARGHFVVQVPYDLYLPNIFQGEESNIGIRSFTYGYDHYAPSKPVVYHYYHYPEGVDTTIKDHKKFHFWDLPNYDEDVAAYAMQRLNSIIQLGENDGDGDVFPTDLEEYGLGKVRTAEQYYRTFGIHTVNQTREENLCMFVASKAMNLLFLPALRKDTMGIDYNHNSLQQFAFKDTWPCKDYWWNQPDCSKETSEESSSED
jgi:hypothetical protein